jgi:pimeloyl-ACP methyl ester carboxylesterase
MSLIVGVHGVGQQLKGPHVLHDAWLPPLRDGLWQAGVELPEDSDLLSCAFYGDLFRKPGTKALGIPPYEAGDLTDDWEKELLQDWWSEAARVEEEVPGPEAQTKGLRTPQFVQRALNALSGSRFFAGIAERAFIFDLKQVHAYLHDPTIRRDVRERVTDVVDAKTRVMIAHSLGSVVAYECLCAHPEWPVHTLVTLGSPLGIRNLIFDLLQPPPRDGIGAWPGSVQRWINIADGGDIVALEKKLGDRFGIKVEDHLIHNGATAHDILPYLTAEETGDAIATGLR